MRDTAATGMLVQGLLYRFGLVPILLLLTLVLVTPHGVHAAPTTARIVVEFSESVVEPEAADFMAELSDYAGTSLSYIRELPSGGHLLRVNRVVNSEHLERVLKQLSHREDVVRAQKDSSPSKPASMHLAW